MSTDAKVMIACMAAFVVLCFLGLTGQLPGQCDTAEKQATLLLCGAKP